MSSTMLRVHNPIFPLVGGLGGLLFLVATIGSFRSGEWMAVLIFGLLTALGLYLCLGVGSIEADEEQIRRISWLGTFAIHWDEVRVLELDTLEQSAVLVGARQKQLVIPGPASWMGRDKLALRALVNRQISTRNITVQRNPWTNLKRCKNTRVSR